MTKIVMTQRMKKIFKKEKFEDVATKLLNYIKHVGFSLKYNHKGH